jgi:hypothetical protein
MENSSNNWNGNHKLFSPRNKSKGFFYNKKNLPEFLLISSFLNNIENIHFTFLNKLTFQMDEKCLNHFRTLKKDLQRLNSLCKSEVEKNIERFKENLEHLTIKLGPSEKEILISLTCKWINQVESIDNKHKEESVFILSNSWLNCIGKKYPLIYLAYNQFYTHIFLNGEKFRDFTFSYYLNKIRTQKSWVELNIFKLDWLGVVGMHNLVNIFEYLPNLKSLSLKQSGITSESALILSEYLHLLENLEIIELSHNPIRTESCEILLHKLSSLGKIRKIDLIDTKLDHTISKGLKKVVSKNTLQELLLDKNNFSQQDRFLKCESFALESQSFFSKSKLKTLSLANCELSSNGMTLILESLIDNSNIQFINFAGNKFSALFLNSLKRFLIKNKNIEAISIFCDHCDEQSLNDMKELGLIFRILMRKESNLLMNKINWSNLK